VNEITNEFIQTLAAANGLQLPQERLELIRAQYARYVDTLKELNALPLPREAEPAIVYELFPGKGR
jgi:hypothetical protein